MQLRRLLLVVVLLLGACTGDSDAASDATAASGGTGSGSDGSVVTDPGTPDDSGDGTGSDASGGSADGDSPAGEDAAGVTSTPTTPTTPTPPSTTTAATVAPRSSTTSPRPAPAPTPTDACRVPAIPPGERSEPIVADIDGDGSQDQVFTVQHEEEWAIVATFGAGGGALTDLVGVDPRSFVRVVGGADIMGRGVDDLVVVTGVGAYTEQVGFVRLSDCDLLELAFDDSSPARFLTGASVNNGEALICPGDGTLERIHFTAIPGSDDDGDPEFEGGFEPFRIEGNVVKRLAPEGGADGGQGIPADGVVLTLDDVSAISLFDCLGLEL